ncbi:MAG: hypothetical protein IJS61_01080 [Firmicutes bacterium]|nr:hypothetical protein [Bacillota bacterium]
MKKNLLTMVTLCLLLCACSSNSVVSDATDQVANVVQADNENVLKVKNGTNSNYPDITYGEAFGSFFSSPTWKYFKGTQEGPDDDGDGKPDYTKEDVDVVEFTGRCTYRDVEVKALLQFVLDKDTDTFQATFLSFNDVPQSSLIMIALLEKAFTSYYEEHKPAEVEESPVEKEDVNTDIYTQNSESNSGSTSLWEETPSDDTPQYADDTPEYYEDTPQYSEEPQQTSGYNYEALEYAGSYQGWSGYNISFSAYSSVSSNEIGVAEIYDSGSYIGRYSVYICDSSPDWDLSQYDQTYIYYDESGGLYYLSFYEEGGVKMLEYNSQYRNTDILEMTEHYVS